MRSVTFSFGIGGGVTASMPLTKLGNIIYGYDCFEINVHVSRDLKLDTKISGTFWGPPPLRAMDFDTTVLRAP